MQQIQLKTITFLLVVISFFSCSQDKTKNFPKLNTDQNSNISLNDNWLMKRAIDVKLNGNEINPDSINLNEWIPAQLPNTVMAILVNNGIYKNPYFKNNMAKIPMDSILQAWWFTKEFELPIGSLNYNYQLHLDGINYKAEIYLNNELVADSNKIKGAFNTFTLVAKPYLKEGKNHITIKLIPPSTGAYTIGFVDWAPTPPDKNMGIWRAVYLKASKTIELSESFVYSKLDTENLKEAELILSTKIKNNSNQKTTFTLNGKFENSNFSKKLILQPNEIKTIVFNSDSIKELKVVDPKLWWPIGYGKPNLYTLELSANIDTIISSSEKVVFGIRKIEDYINENGHRGYKVNGKKILVNGAGWVDKLFLENDTAYDKTQVKYVKDMGMNCIRFEGFWGNDHHIYDLCDENGLLAMVGFSCQWEWHDYIGTPCNEDKFGCADEKDEIELVADYWTNQIKWMRNHASIFTWVAGSDFLPHPDLEKKLIKSLKENDPSRPYLGAAKWHSSEVSGNTGVKMEGPYDYVTPNYWYTDTLRGGAFGFNTETGPGPQPPVLSSLLEMYGDSLNYPIDSTWNYHHGRHAFGTMGKYLKAFDARYGESETLEDFALVSQIANYEAIRPMFEAFRINQPNTTGIIQWMLNSAWPETYWQLYDFYLQPTGAYFGTKKANQKNNCVYNYGNNKVYFINDNIDKLDSVVISIQKMNSDSKVVFNLDTTLYNLSKGIFELVELTTAKKGTEFLFTNTINSTGENFNNNYWISAKKDVVDPNYENSSWIYTPNLSFADFKDLRKLPKATLTKTIKNTQNGLLIIVKNESPNIAFGVEFTLVDSLTKKAVVPALWSDNYLVLKPGADKAYAVKLSLIHI